MKKISSLYLALLSLGTSLSAQEFNDYMKAVEQHNAAYTAERYSIDIAEAQTTAAHVWFCVNLGGDS